MREIRILPAVSQDISEAAAWYDREGHPGLGERFVDTFYRCLPKIGRNGTIYRTVYQDFRRVINKPFPYSVYFRDHAGTWIVTLVIHSARSPSLARGILHERKGTSK